MIKLTGAVLIVAGCLGFGYSLGAAHRTEEKMLRSLRSALQEMQWELKYRMTQLPELCEIASAAARGPVGELLEMLAGKLRRQEVEDIAGTVNALLNQRLLPKRVRRNLRQLGTSLGRFDLEGQLQGLEAVRQQCCADLKELEECREQRLRCYQTLAVCTGTALAILLI